MVQNSSQYLQKTMYSTGNLLTVEEIGTPIKTFSYNEANQITNTGFSYDDNGNLTSDGTYTFIYDGENRLKKVIKVSDGSTVAEYAYEYLGRRTSKTVSGQTTYFHYDACYYLLLLAPCIEVKQQSNTKNVLKIISLNTLFNFTS